MSDRTYQILYSYEDEEQFHAFMTVENHEFENKQTQFLISKERGNIWIYPNDSKEHAQVEQIKKDIQQAIGNNIAKPFGDILKAL
jgi:hypothetical protein